MIYADLDKIPLSKFVEVFMGNIEYLIISGKHDKQELIDVSHKLRNEYMGIIGGKVLLSEISRKNEIMNLSIKIDSISACNSLIKLNDWDSVCNILASFGYIVSADDKTKISQRIDSILANCQYRRDKLLSHDNKPDAPTMDHDYFTKERVMIMSHFKMHIDKDTYTAKEYAFLVKRMCDDIDSMNRRSNH